MPKRCQRCGAPSPVDVWETLTLFGGALLFAAGALGVATFGFLWLLETGWGWTR